MTKKERMRKQWRMLDAMIFSRLAGLSKWAVLALPLAIGAAWVGCATASEEPGEPATPPSKDSDPSLETSGDVDVDEDGNPIFDATDEVIIPDTGLMCPGVTASNTCATAIEIATLAVGGKTVVNGAITATGERWYKVTFTGTDDLAAHPRIKLTSTDPGVVIEVMNACAGPTATCGDEDATAKITTDFERSYKADPAADGSADPDANADEADAADAKIPITVGTGGVLYFRAYRKAGATSCDYKLDVSN